MTKTNTTALILILSLFISCATKKAEELPTHHEQAKLSKSFQNDPEEKSTYVEYLEHKTGNEDSKVCVENDHEDLGHWSIYSKSDLKKPIIITMQADDHRYQCVTVPEDMKDLVLKAEAYGKDGIYRCTVDVKAGEQLNVNDEGHPLICGKTKGSK